MFNFDELNVYDQQILNIAENEMPRETKKFVRKEGQKLKTKTRKKARSKVKKRTGNYLKGIKNGKVYKYSGNGGTSIRVYSGKPAYHAHLIEYGHIIKNKSGEEVGFAPGYHVFQEAADEFQPEFYNDVQKFIDEMADEL